MTPDLVLASTSRYRRDLLARLGISFRCVAPDVDEDPAKNSISDPVRLAENLAAAKAEAVAARLPDAVVIGSDQLATIDGEILGKPGLPGAAVDQLTRLSGRTHELVTAVCMIGPDSRLMHTDVTRLRMRGLSRDALTRYVAIDDPTDCAGSYKIEGVGIALFDRIETEDFTAITGLPLIAVTRMLCDFGFAIP